MAQIAVVRIKGGRVVVTLAAVLIFVEIGVHALIAFFDERKVLSIHGKNTRVTGDTLKIG